MIYLFTMHINQQSNGDVHAQITSPGITVKALYQTEKPTFYNKW